MPAMLEHSIKYQHLDTLIPKKNMINSLIMKKLEVMYCSLMLLYSSIILDDMIVNGLMW